MPKVAKELSAKAVRDLNKPGTYAAGGVAGLNVVVTPSGAKCWILRTKVGSKRREIGLGGFPSVTLSQARDRAREEKEKIRQGIDTVAERKAAKLALIQAQARGITFKDAAKQCHEVKSQEFKNAKHSAQWINTLEKYAYPTLGNLPVADIDTPEVLAALKPIWTNKPETASRVRQRIAAVFDWALASKIRMSSNPAAWKGCLDAQLPNPSKVKKRKTNGTNHHPALPVDDIPRFMIDLSAKTSISAKALTFAVLTTARSGEVRFATWKEINWKDRVWRISADRMKAEKPHTVPLSDAAIEILESLPRDYPAGLIFPSQRGTELSDMALSKLLKDMHLADLEKGGPGYLDPLQDRIATPHGTARSSFKDWSLQNNRYPDEWSELALAHVNSDRTRAAYARGGLLEERRGMMEAWGQFCFPPRISSQVVAFARGTN